MTEPLRLRSNEYWGKRAGSVSTAKGPHFHIKRGSGNGGTSNSATPGRRSYHTICKLLAAAGAASARRSKPVPMRAAA